MVKFATLNKGIYAMTAYFLTLCSSLKNMTVKQSTFLLVLISCAAFGQRDKQTLIGQWNGVQGSDTMTFIFSNDGIITMLNKTRNETMGGRESMRLGKKVRLTYATDLTKKPFALDLIIQEIETKKEQGRMKGIFEFLNGEQIKINFGPGNDRPTTFDHFSVTMTRVQ